MHMPMDRRLGATVSGKAISFSSDMIFAPSINRDKIIVQGLYPLHIMTLSWRCWLPSSWAGLILPSMLISTLQIQKRYRT